jgi:murein DD-endopeptidase MepM/ murein hydrolase activator NlpD
MTSPTVDLPISTRIIARLRWPAEALSLLTILVSVVCRVAGAPFPTVLAPVATVLLVAAALSGSLTPRAEVPAAALSTPLAVRSTAVNSPSTRVPSHGTHGFGQTYAVDLVPTPEGTSWPPPDRGTGRGTTFLRPEQFPGFGSPVLAPASGTVVHTLNIMRDHRSRIGSIGLAYLMVESMFREMIGSPTMLGNHVVIRMADGTHTVCAHLRRGSVRVRAGEQVRAGQQIGRCGNSGNTTEPHLHCQRQDVADPAFAVGLPWTLAGRRLPANMEVLDAPVHA